jgi:phosphatidate cytidylyltransferase
MSNLFQRVLVALAGIPLLVFLTTFGSWPLLIFVVFLQILLMREWIQISAAIGARLNISILIIAAACIDYAVVSSAEAIALAAIYLAFLLMLLIEIFRVPRQPLKNLGASILFLAYIILPLILWTQFKGLDIDNRYGYLGPLTILMATIWICDSAAYFIGRSLGKHKLYPAASPNKTIEGGVAGVVSSALVLPVMAVFNWAAPRPLDYLILPVLVGIIGQLGDLLESLIKREVNVKDSSHFLPGHGGLLDRFDSLLLSTPFFFLYLILLK